MANKKYRLRGNLSMATRRGRCEVELLSLFLDFLKNIEADVMVCRMEDGRSLKDPLTYEEVCETIEKAKARIERRRAAWGFARGLSSIDGDNTSPEMKEMIEQEIRGEITTEDIKHRLDEKYSKMV